MSTTDNLNEIREKLAKLKNLQNGAGTQGEAMASAAAISRILLQYNLSMQDIPDIDGNGHKFEKETIDLDTTSLSVYHWRADLLGVIAEAHFCKFVRIMPYKGMKLSGYGHLIGERANMEVVMSLYNYLKEEIRNLTRNSWKIEAPYRTKKSETKWKSSFRLGCVATLRDRFKAMRKEFYTTDKSNALVIQKEKELQDAMKELLPGTSALARNTTMDMAGFAGGAENAKSLKLQNEVAEKRVALNA